MISDGPSPATAVPDELVRDLRSALLRHYDRSRRDLPWRGETDPYRVWVSEVMLQQTRVETVLGYYGPWLAQFPDVEALAGASLDDVLVQWQGLGYYRRARNLHRAAGVVRERHRGRVPGSYRALRTLPGVGDYTAGAVASIAFGEPVPAVDGNVRRVLARLFDEAEPARGWLRSVAFELVDRDRPGDWNQALMDLGATVCTPADPSCGSCPLAAWCNSRARGTQAERPARAPRRRVRTLELATAVVADREGRVLVVRRPEEGLLGGMWSFPSAPLAEGGRPVDAAHAAARAAGAELDSGAACPLAPVQHRFTHLQATYRPVLLHGQGGGGEGRRWIAPDGPWGVGLPVAQQKIARAAAAALSGAGS